MRNAVCSLLLIITSGCGPDASRIDMSEYVLIYPGAPVIELPQKQKTITVKVRNVSEIELTALRLSVKSDACTAKVSPADIKALVPGDQEKGECLHLEGPGPRPSARCRPGGSPDVGQPG